ncbi:MAG: hypothetical protein M3P93_02415 [Actinomycetota bacterium]|nr:hypothetical protein [Actinomycetota bacterium]
MLVAVSRLRAVGHSLRCSCGTTGETIKAKRLLTLPAPDYSRVHPDGLPY